MNSMHLVGAEDVARAGAAVREAAGEMQRAAGEIHSALETHRRLTEETVSRFEEACDLLALTVVAQADVGFVHAENLHIESVHKGTMGGSFYSLTSPAVDALRERLKKKGVVLG